MSTDLFNGQQTTTQAACGPQSVPTGRETDAGYVNAIDLCSGAGGMSLGLQRAGFNVRAAFDTDPAARATYNEHIGQYGGTLVSGADIRDVDVSMVPDNASIGCVAGGPPCQPFSSSGTLDKSDPRIEVTYAVLDWIEALTPRVAIIENVPGLKTNYPNILRELLDRLRDMGYQAGRFVADAPDYCVPQERSRLFLVAVHKAFDKPDRWKPPACHTDSGQQRLGHVHDHDPYRTAADALGDLPEPLAPREKSECPVHRTYPNDDSRVRPTVETWVVDGEDGYTVENGGMSGDVLMPPNHVATDHRDDTREKYAEWPEGYCGGSGANSTTDRRLDPDEPAPTMTNSNGTPPVHYQGRSPGKPDEPVSSVRRLTPREVARLQTFPDRYGFAGSRMEQYSQAANAVPVRLAEHIAHHLRSAVW